MKITKGQMRSGFTLVELLVVISIIVVLAGLAVPTAMKGLAKAEQVAAISNVKQIKAGLDLFAGDFDGEYPSDDTAAELAEIMDDNTGSSSKRKSRSSGLNGGRLDKGGRLGGRGGSSRASASNQKPSNYYFNQLMGRGLDNEELFFQKSFKKVFRLKRLNNDKVVDKGENVWGYTKNLQQTSSGRVPLIFDSPVSTGDNPKFSKKVWDKKIIVARLDNSTRSLLIGGSDSKIGSVTEKLDDDRINLFSEESLEEGTLTSADIDLIGSGN